MRTILNVTVTKNFVSFITHTNTISVGFCFFILFFGHIYLSQTAVVALSPTLTKNYYYKYDLITLVTFVCSAATENNNKVYTKKNNTPQQFISAIFLFAVLVYICGKEGEDFSAMYILCFFRTSKTLVLNDPKVAGFIL